MTCSSGASSRWLLMGMLGATAAVIHAQPLSVTTDARHTSAIYLNLDL